MGNKRPDRVWVGKRRLCEADVSQTWNLDSVPLQLTNAKKVLYHVIDVWKVSPAEVTNGLLLQSITELHSLGRSNENKSNMVWCGYRRIAKFVCIVCVFEKCITMVGVE
jgi:hypothetical protein